MVICFDVMMYNVWEDEMQAWESWGGVDVD